MLVHRLWLRDFRSYATAEFVFGDGLTVVTGRNGAGKTNLLESVAYLSSLRSFRGAPSDALVRSGSERAIVRAETLVEQRNVLIEAEIATTGRSRTLVNKQPLRRTRDLLGVLRVSVFSPEDLILVKGGPGERRTWLDEALVALHPRHAQVIDDTEKVLRQRNALLKQIGGRLDAGAALTLDVWDSKLAATGTALGDARVALLTELAPLLALAYDQIAEEPLAVTATYASAWFGVPGGLDRALEQGRADDVRRGLSLVGPHRDDVVLSVDGRPSRTHASQGEQRTLALAMRLAVHRLVAQTLGWVPVLLLDDVFSELDPHRSAALVRHLPVGQALLATATGAPAGVEVSAVLDVERGSEGSQAAFRVPSSPPERAVDKPVESVDDIASKVAK